MHRYLKWVLNVKLEELAEFETEVKRDCLVGGFRYVRVVVEALINILTSTTLH